MSIYASLCKRSGALGYLVNLANLSLVLATNHNNSVPAPYMDIMAHWFFVVIEFVVLPSLAWALQF